MKAVLLGFACLLALAVATPALLNKETMIFSRGWTRVSRADPATPITAHVFVKQTNTDELTRQLFAVSDPQSPQYGQHLTQQQVHDLVAPTAESVRVVLAWLAANGVPAASIKASPNSDILTFDTTVGTMERLLHAEYQQWRHDGTGYAATRALSYSLPADVHAHIDFVGPTVRLPPMSRTKRAPIQPEAALVGVNPTSLLKLYSVPAGYRASSSQSNIALCGFLEQYIDQPDVDSFFKSYAPSEFGRKLEIVGKNTPSNPGIEAMLDVEYGMAMGAGVQRSVFWYTPGRMPNSTQPDNEPYLQFLADLSASSNPPSLFSISYGDDEDSVQFDYGNRVGIEFQKAGARGITVMSSSGDGGVSGSQPQGCSKFIPTFPAALPWITAIGGTTGTSPEIAAGLSAGGISNYWARPDYQTSFVSQYFSTAKNLPPASKYNQTGAGFPDISAQAENFVIVIDGFSEGVSGTSCSSPTVAGIFALLNDIRYQAGKAPLGWLNPLLYQNPTAFNDITSGSNPGCGTNGFPAAPGWDPVTGLGTPNFGKLSAIVQNLP